MQIYIFQLLFLSSSRWQLLAAAALSRPIHAVRHYPNGSHSSHVAVRSVRHNADVFGSVAGVGTTTDVLRRSSSHVVLQ